MPSTRTLREWTHSIKFIPGILHSVLNMLKEYFSTAPDAAKDCALAIDEMGTEPTYAYDPSEDRIYGQVKSLNAYVLRGLTEEWKQLVAFKFDDDFSEEWFVSLLQAIGSIGLRVRAVVSDLGVKNRRLMNKFNVNVRKENEKIVVRHSMKNPTFPDIKIHFFADMPHLIKLLRNHTLEHGIVLNGGYKIEKADFEKLLRMDKAEFKSAWKLKDEHLNVKGKNRINYFFIINHVGHNLLLYSRKNETESVLCHSNIL